MPYLANKAPLGVWKLLIRWAVAVPLGYISLKSIIIICKTEKLNNFIKTPFQLKDNYQSVNINRGFCNSDKLKGGRSKKRKM